MLVIISDLHIADGSTSTNVDESAFTKILGPSILDSLKHKNATELHIVLLGDIFDLVRTHYWVKSVPGKNGPNVPPGERPWNGKLDPLTAMNSNTAAMKEQFSNILADILETPSAQGFLSMLKSLAGAVKGKRTKVTYVVGNHDRVLNNYVELQNQIRKEVSKKIDLSFATKLEAPAYGVLARHGHEWDEECHALTLWNEVMHEDQQRGRFDPEIHKMMAIGDVITAELMGGFIYKIGEVFKSNGWNSVDDTEFLTGLRDINSLRPLTAMFAWLRWYSRNRNAKYQEVLKTALLFGLDNLLDSEFAKTWDDISKPVFPGYLFGDITDHLDAARDDLRSGGLPKVEQTMIQLLGLKSIKDFFVKDKNEDGLLKGAEQDFNTANAGGNIQYVVYGHTHEARQDFFNAGVDGRVSMYINTGTYLPFFQLCRDEKGFASAHFMTMAFFYKNDEDNSNRKGNGPTMELWDGIRRKFYREAPTK